MYVMLKYFDVDKLARAKVNKAIVDGMVAM